MIFRHISYRIALQFTTFVFLLLLVTGSIFLFVDVVSRERMVHTRLERQLIPLLERSEQFGTLPTLPPFQRGRIRIMSAAGESLFSGTLYDNIPFDPDDGMATVVIDGESYDVLTTPYRSDGQLIGYIQVADRSPPNDLLLRFLLFLAVSTGISGLTFGVGLFFARRSLKPAEQMMERLEQFTQDASHELKTPLTAVSTSIELALLTKSNRRHLLDAKKDLKEIVALIERMLELARLDRFALQTEPVALTPLVEHVIAKHRAMAKEKRVTLASDLVRDVTVDADPMLLRQVIGNLLVNAIKFNKAGGSVRVILTQGTLRVEDTGRGIAAQALRHIFDRFYQEDASRTKPADGTGLGLALVKRIVDLHGWTIDVQSKKNRGTTFTVHFGKAAKHSRR